MEVDLESYKKHDRAYKSLDVETAFSKMKILDKLDFFNFYGFAEAIRTNPKVRDLHVDIGSGAGWLIKHTAPIFKKVLSVEPSVRATEISKIYNSEFSNIEYLNEDMVLAFSHLPVDEPYFVTTSAVFCHIKDFHVENFLRLLNHAPKGTVLLFCEPYDKNIQQPFWHIRNQEWWRKNLPLWNLEFRGIKGVWEGKVEPYKKVIYGVCVGERVVEPTTLGRRMYRKLWWGLQGIFFKLRYALVRFIKKVFRI